MKKMLLPLSLAAIVTFAACSDAPKGDKALVADQQIVTTAAGNQYTVDTTASTVHFTGNGVGKNHPGVFKVSNGTLAVNNGTVTGGQFDIDINSMSMDEKEEIFQTKLRGHLLNADFFDAEKFPAARFEITKVEPYTTTGTDSSVIAGANAVVSGNLTLKETTKNISFPAKIDLAGNAVTAQANFDIDRTWWNIKYGADKSLGDKFISETVNIKLKLKAIQ